MNTFLLLCIIWFYWFFFYPRRRIQREEEAINARKEAEEVRTCTALYCTIYILSSALHLLLSKYVCSIHSPFHPSLFVLINSFSPLCIFTSTRFIILTYYFYMLFPLIIFIYYFYSEDSRGCGSGGTENIERLRWVNDCTDSQCMMCTVLCVVLYCTMLICSVLLQHVVSVIRNHT